jgi:hypothetical protein
MVKHTERKKCIELRRNGWTHTMIRKELRVSKGTVSRWCEGIKCDEKARAANAFVNHQDGRSRRGETMKAQTKQRYDAIMAESKKRIMRHHIGKNTLSLIGSMLYWGEGDKVLVYDLLKITNADPSIHRFFISWIIKCHGAKKEKIRAKLFIHPDVNVNDALSYWATELGLSLVQFNKPIILMSRAVPVKKKRPYGWIQVYYCDKKMFARVLGEIEGYKELSKRQGI